ncbi:hypothetical protein SAMN04489841_1657 [Natrinema salaciae]|uniref:Uncharacterized protein n=1 Tax=Natrinema salaciae TaxID=1186196 RepID=A0A1H9FRK2_9EURY|nr:hypothetical protein SAMN04489841_1657 [Natrinema salaciae]
MPVVASYKLECTDCSFQTIVVGEYETVLVKVEAHQENTGRTA